MSFIRWLPLLGLGIVLAAANAPRAASADEVRYFTENNTLYRETRRFVERPVTEAQAAGLISQAQPVSSAVGKPQQYYRARWVQVVEYRYEPIWGTCCSATCQPCLIPRWVPYTRWAWQHEPAPVTVETRPVGLATQSAAFWPGNRTRYVVEEVVERTPIAHFGGRTGALAADPGRTGSSPTAAAATASASGPVSSPAATGKSNALDGESGFRWAEGMPAYGNSAGRNPSAVSPNDNRTATPSTSVGQGTPNDSRTATPVNAPSLVSPGPFAPSAAGRSSPSNPPSVLNVPYRPGPTSPAPPSGIAPPYSDGNRSNAQPSLPAGPAAVPAGTLPQGGGGYTPPSSPASAFPTNSSLNQTYAPPGGFSPQGFGGSFGAAGTSAGSTNPPSAMQPSQRGLPPGVGGVLRLDQDPPRYGWPSR